MDIAIWAAFAVYFSIIFVIGLIAYQRSKKAADYILGNRSLNYWVTALAAQASDMSGWLFMAYPATIYAGGLIQAWTAIGLTALMFLNWHFIAPKLRTATEKTQSLTLSSYFEARFGDTSGMLRVISAVFCLIYFACYISANLAILGHLFESVFNVGYQTGILFGSLVVFYVLLGGFISIAWIDTFQGYFLLAMIILVPSIACMHIPGFSSIAATAEAKNITLSLIPNFSWNSIWEILFAASWGLGYFGMPHIITKFMGIDDVKNIKYAKYVGISWQILTLSAATFVGLIGIVFFQHGLVNNEFIFVQMVQELFPPFFGGIILCSILATSINVMGAQVLSSASLLSEDFYKKFFLFGAKPNDIKTQKMVALVSRVGVFFLCAFALVIASYNSNTSIYNLVRYAWNGLGCSFGPLIIISLHTKLNNKYAAVAGILAGGICAGIWPLFYPAKMAMIAGFCFSFAAILLTEKVFSSKSCCWCCCNKKQ